MMFGHGRSAPNDHIEGISPWERLRRRERMQATLPHRHLMDEEARAEVDVLKSRLDKTSQLTKKIQASLGRLNDCGRALDEAVGPLHKNSQKDHVLLKNIDALLAEVEKIKKPADIKSNEEEILRRGPEKAGVSVFLDSITRISQALADMKRMGLRTNQQAQADLARLQKSGNNQLEVYFQKLLQQDSRPIEPLHYITKDIPFPALENTPSLGIINSYFVTFARNSGIVGESPLIQVYASVRGPYLNSILANMAVAVVNTAKKKTPGEVYRRGSNGIVTYAQGMEGAFTAEYNNVCTLFSREEWGKAYNLTCQGAISELARTLRDLNTHIKGSMSTECYLAYEIIEAISMLSSNLEEATGELKPSFAAALKPIRETAKLSLGELIDETRRKINAMPTIPADASTVPVTFETMTRLQNMVEFLRPLSGILLSVGNGGWKASPNTAMSPDIAPSLNSFDIAADGEQIFGSYCADTIEALMSTLQARSQPIMKSKGPLGAFLLNNITIVLRMISASDLKPLLADRMRDIEKWRDTGTRLYVSAWGETSKYLLDVQYTNRGAQRPPSGNASMIDSTAIIKGLSSKDKDAIKEKFRLFNVSFEDLVAKHKALKLEKEVRDSLARDVQQVIEPLYGRFWDRYHEVDKGKGKYVKWDKASISAVFLGLA